MSVSRPTEHPAHRRRRFVSGVATVAALLVSSCGLPGSGTVRTVDDGDVPYRLLESDMPSPPAATGGAPAQAPVVFWTVGERLQPEVTDVACTDGPEVVVERLLSILTTGPSEDARAAGRSSAVPTDFGLELVDLSDGTVEVGIEPETSLSAEQLPLAVGQVVLTVTSAPTIRSVVLVDDGEPVQVPLPEGVLTEEPVTARDYAELLPARPRAPGTFGCPSR